MKRALAAALAGLACAAAHAVLPDEIQVYSDDLEKRGERGVEIHVNTTPSGRSTSAYPGEVTPYHGLRITPEISWGLGHGMDWGLYLPFSRTADGTVYFAGPKFRLKWMPLLPAEGGTGAFAGVNGEIAFVDERFEEPRRVGEIRPIAGYRGSGWLFALNPILELDFAGEQKGKPVFAPAAKVSREVSRRLSLGAEYYATLGRLSHFAPRAEQEHVLFLVLDTEWLNFGIGRGFSGAADRWTVKAIFAF